MATTLRIETTYANKPVAVTLWATDCPNCAVVFAIPERMQQERYNDGKSFYCPNGHSMSWSVTETDRLHKKLADVEADRKYAWQVYQEADADRKRTAASLRVTKGHLTRLKNRVEAGVCIHCNRTFQALAKHMKTKHAGVIS